jgi:hypothetical protein
MALTMTPMTTQLMASVPRDRAGMGSATNDTTRELGGALGVAVLGSLLTSQYSSGMSSVLAQIPEQARAVAEGSLGGMHGLIARGVLPADTPLLDVAKDAFVDGLTVAATVGAVVVGLAAIAVKRFLPSDRLDPMITGEQQPESEPVAGR